MDNNNGWVKLHRKLFDWQWYQDGNTIRIFLHLLLSANHAPKKWRGITIERGDVLTGRKALSIATGIPEQSVRTSLTRLKSTSEITIKSTSLYSIISICNYNTYQDDKKEINQVTNQQANQQLTSGQPAANQRLTTNKNDNNVKNEKNNTKQGDVFKLPEYINPEIWKAYLEMRVSIKKPLKTNHQVKLAISTLEKLKSIGHNPDDVINQSILNSWAGLFALKINIQTETNQERIERLMR